jgi:hypothetical protein
VRSGICCLCTAQKYHSPITAALAAWHWHESLLNSVYAKGYAHTDKHSPLSNLHHLVLATRRYASAVALRYLTLSPGDEGHLRALGKKTDGSIERRRLPRLPLHPYVASRCQERRQRAKTPHIPLVGDGFIPPSTTQREDCGCEPLSSALARAAE